MSFLWDVIMSFFSRPKNRETLKVSEVENADQKEREREQEMRYKHLDKGNIHDGVFNTEGGFIIRESHVFVRIARLNGIPFFNSTNGSVMMSRQSYWNIYNELTKNVLSKWGDWQQQTDLSARIPHNEIRTYVKKYH